MKTNGASSDDAELLGEAAFRVLCAAVSVRDTTREELSLLLSLLLYSIASILRPFVGVEHMTAAAMAEPQIAASKIRDRPHTIRFPQLLSASPDDDDDDDGNPSLPMPCCCFTLFASDDLGGKLDFVVGSSMEPYIRLVVLLLRL